MTKGVFDTKPGSGYDDDLAAGRYHFPARRNYLAVAHAVTGDWVLLREPQRNGGRRAYIGAGRVIRVEPDRRRIDHAYAFFDDQLSFAPPVPFSGGPLGYWEDGLRAVGAASRVGQTLQGRAMRLISDGDFAAIVDAGLSANFEPENLVRYADGVHEDASGAPPLTGYPDAASEWSRRIELRLVNKKVRDANFRRQVCEAYDNTCAVTRLRIINGGGRSEVQAAHIWPVETGGPDIVQNGLALSGTIHWLFDRHLISLTDDYRLLVSHNKVPAELRSLFANQMDRIHLPADARLHPHPAFLRRHREAFAA